MVNKLCFADVTDCRYLILNLMNGYNFGHLRWWTANQVEQVPDAVLYEMAIFWSKIKDTCFTEESQQRTKRKSPRMASLALEVLENREEAQDVVYYDALKRINADHTPTDISPLKKTRKRGLAIASQNSNFSHKYSSSENATPEKSSKAVHKQITHKIRRKYACVRKFRSFIRDTHLLLIQSINKAFHWISSSVLDPEEDLYFTWMGVVTSAVLYNYCVLILRIAFQEMRTRAEVQSIFWSLDLMCDVLYVCDVGVQCRTGYRDDHGMMVEEADKLLAHYRKQSQFKMDIVAALPFDTIYSWKSGNKDTMYPLLLRFLRLLKLQCAVHFFFLSDYRTSKPNRLRAAKLSLYLGIAMHWVACLYYMISEYEGLGSNDWVHPREKQEDHDFKRKYIKSLYWSVLTLTTIGETPNPHTNLEYIFTGSMFLLGIFVFAAVVGNVGDIISNLNAARADFQGRMDLIKQYMDHHNVPEEQQNRVKRWAFYAWTRTQALDEALSLNMLPQRLRAEIVIHVHLETLKKVKLFKDCEEGLLCELVLKLRPQVFSPGDYICRMGEIGREMYIINHGKVEVAIPNSVTGENVVVACLSEGNYFGEISLLRLDGGRNRRSADVRSVGYSELLCLSQNDLMETLEEYPEAKRGLECQGRDRLQRTKTEVNLRVHHQPNGIKRREEIALSFATEMQDMKKVLEDMRELQEKAGNDRITYLEAQCSALTSELGYLKSELRQSHKKIEEMRTRELVYAVPCTANDSVKTPDQRRRRLAKPPSEELLQRIVRAATQASQNVAEWKRRRACPEEPSGHCEPLNCDDTEYVQNRTCTLDSRSIPTILIDNDLDGVCCSVMPSGATSQTDLPLIGSSKETTRDIVQSSD